MDREISQFGRALQSGIVGGAVGGMVAALGFALIVAANSFGIAPWLFAAVVIACGTTGAWLANSYLRTRLRPFGVAEALGGALGVWVALLALTPILNPNARSEAFVLDFVALVTLVGVAVGALGGAIAGAMLGLLERVTVDALRPWFWLVGMLIAVAITGGSLIFEPNNIVAALAPVSIPGGALAGWLAQREYLRLTPTRTQSATLE